MIEGSDQYNAIGTFKRAVVSRRIFTVSNYMSKWQSCYVRLTRACGSFVAFKVEWPSPVGACISWIMDLSTLIKFDFMEFPSLACIWASYSYTHKTYVKLATPIVVGLLLAIPVGAARLMAERSAKCKEDFPRQLGLDIKNTDYGSTSKIIWKKRYDRTLNVFWNNIVSSGAGWNTGTCCPKIPNFFENLREFI